jgi:hypothetical protein
MEKKICSKCKIEKDVCNFGILKSSKDGYRNICKECRKNEKDKNKGYYLNKGKEWRLNNQNNVKEYNKKYFNKNREKLKILWKEYRKKNKSSMLVKKKEYIDRNRDILNLKTKERLTNDPVFKLIKYSRNRIRQYLKTKDINKSNTTLNIIGCPPEFLKEHIEKQFTEGMSWDLMGKHIHIDHIIPLSSAKTEEEIYKLCHYTNLQPLWAEDNLKKSNKIL